MHGEKKLLRPLNPRGERHLSPPADGNAAGFHRHYRRPRSTMTDECMSIDRAERIETFEDEMREMQAEYGDDSY